MVLVFVTLAAAARADDLPRKSKAPRETYPNVDVIYDSVTAPDGKRLRAIITKPHETKAKLPVIFLTGWLSCDSVEAPADTKDTIGLILRGLAQTPGFCLFKIDKPGCGDSEGDCSQTDFDTELAGYRAAFRALKNYDFIDSDRVYIFGSSNGGGFAPLVPETECRTGAGARLHHHRRVGQNLVRAHARHRTPAFRVDEKIARRSHRQHKRCDHTLL